MKSRLMGDGVNSWAVAVGDNPNHRSNGGGVRQEDFLLGKPLFHRPELSLQGLFPGQEWLLVAGEPLQGTATSHSTLATAYGSHKSLCDAGRQSQLLRPLLKLFQPTVDLDNGLLEPLVSSFELLVLFLQLAVKGPLTNKVSRPQDR